MRLGRAHVKAGGPRHPSFVNCERLPFQRQPCSKALYAGVLLPLKAGAFYGLPMSVQVDRRERVNHVVASCRDFLPDPVGMDEGVSDKGAVKTVGVDGRLVSEILRQAPFNSRGDVKFIVAPVPVTVSVADEPMPDGEAVVAVRDHVSGCIVDRGNHAWRGSEAEYVDGRRVAERPFTLSEVRMQMETVPVAERPVQVHDGGSLFEFGSVPHDVAIREAATRVALHHCAGRIAERAGVALVRVAVSQRDRPYALEFPVGVTPDDPDGVAADTDIAGFVERTALLPDGAAVLPAP